MAFSSEPSPRKKKRKLPKKKHRSNNKGNSTELSSCNITGTGGSNVDDFGGVDFGLGNELDCLNELASAQVGDSPPSSSGNKNIAGVAEEIVQMPQSKPPSLDEIPNLRVELARHLQVESLSSFLLQSCPGLRMPTFERWLLDSKHEESDRMQSIAENWAIDPSIKLQLKNKKKKYGRAALHSEENATQGREDARTMRESRILLDAEKSTNNYNSSKGNSIDRLAKKAKALIDPVLPGNPLDSDQSSKRLVDEIVANSMKMSDDNDDDDMNMKGKAEEIVGELLSRCIESVKEIQQLQNRFGMYQQFPFLNKAAKNSGSSSGLVRVEWPSGETLEDSVCSLSYITTKSSSTTTSDNMTGENKKKVKPFIVKVNGQHYHKLRRLFDKTFACVDTQLTKDQIAHAFHAALFVIIVRYSTLAGGQQLKSLRGGGMQGAIHDTMFDCFTKWFGASSNANGGSGTECFASPFNSNIAQYYSAFPSPDIDGFFGSRGEFFSLHAECLQPGWYEINPPFSPGLMEKMANRLIELLNAANSRNIDVKFIVIIPSCSQINNNDASNKGQSAFTESKEKKKKKKKRKHDRVNEELLNTNSNAFTHTIHHGASSSFNKLVNRCNSHIVLSKRDHGYVEGSQHLRPTQFKESQYDSSVIVLTSNSCAEIDKDTFEADVREAFRSRHVAELQQRRDKG